MFVSSIRYGYIRSRQLEGTYPGDPKEGVWPITSNRIQFGWGMVSESEWPYFGNGDFLDPEPPGLDRAAKRNRIRRYQRVRNSTEARILLKDNSVVRSRFAGSYASKRGTRRLEIKLAFEITPQFLNAPKGLVATQPPECPVLGTHSVPLMGYSPPQQWFEFANSWRDWGDAGRGYMPLEYFDERMIDCWATDLAAASFPDGSGIHEIQWDVPDPLGDRVYGTEVYDGDADERIGWSFAVHRGDHLDVEEFYVRPVYRRQGHGARLAKMLIDLSQKKELPLRAWIPFADCEEANRPALANIMLKLGLGVRPSGVRWAAYRAIPSKKRLITFSSIEVPPRPAFARSAAPIGSPSGTISEGVCQIPPYEGELSEEALTEIAGALFCELDAKEAADASS
jgi:GNAT superfamily N-acetyltransferase